MDYQLLTGIITNHPELKKGFISRELLRYSSSNWQKKRRLKELFGSKYKKIITPILNFDFKDKR
jgi:hypothetical protein